MQWYEIIFAAIMFIFMLFLIAGGYILQRDRYWIRVWKKLGKPEVKTIKELKNLISKQNARVKSK